MLIYKKGDILQATENIICHQVNVDGIMGGGLALQIARTYPEIEKKYKKFCYSFNNDYQKLKGIYQNIKCNDTQFIANCFTQKPNFDTDYNAIKVCFNKLLSLCKENNKTIAVPYGYGSGIANGDWDTIENIFKELSDKHEANINIYKLEKQNESRISN